VGTARFLNKDKKLAERRPPSLRRRGGIGDRGRHTPTVDAISIRGKAHTEEAKQKKPRSKGVAIILVGKKFSGLILGGEGIRLQRKTHGVGLLQ